MPKTVVVIDDDADDLDTMRETLNQVDPTIDCITYVYPEDALRALTQAQVPLPDFIFIDINMPKVSGIECLNRLRQLPDFRDTPIIIYSTSLPEKVSEQLFDKGASFTMEKPSKLADYLSALEAIVLETGIPNRHIRSNC